MAAQCGPISALILVALLALIPAQSSSDHLKVVPASEILAKIQKGDPVKYDHIIVKGDLNLNQLELPKEHVNRSTFESYILGLSDDAKLITSPIEIRNATVDGNVNFNDTVFYSPIDFSGSNFASFANFHGARFNLYADAFPDVVVSSGSAYFDNARFNKGIDVIGASGLVSFMNAQFNEIALFWGAQLYNADFSGAQFLSSYTDFRKAQFLGFRLSFSEAQFSDLPLFDEAQFNADTYFIGTKFNGKAHFVGSQFSKNVDFTYAKFGGDAVFNGAKFRGYIIGWGNIENVFKCDEATYLGLIRNFKDYGQFSDADNCYYDYMNWRRDQNPGFSKFFDYALWAICGYGVKPLRVIFFSIFIFAMFSVFYKSIVIEIKFTEALWLSMSALLSLPKELHPLGYRKYKKFIESRTRGLNLIRYLYIFERLIGWGLLIIFINTLSRVMIRY